MRERALAAHVIARLAEAGQGHFDADADIAPVRALLDQGCDLEADVVPTVARTLPELPRPLKRWDAPSPSGSDAIAEMPLHNLIVLSADCLNQAAARGQQGFLAPAILRPSSGAGAAARAPRPGRISASRSQPCSIRARIGATSASRSTFQFAASTSSPFNEGTIGRAEA
jgi:hypothetical protein